ncbi:MAG TPA: oligosaccharide flippase family protein, partial [Candidatus Paceibacterota bacterium]|nr:oligosaccharide flippase family protein [Candidatus Paceibacterota bacterium]
FHKLRTFYRYKATVANLNIVSKKLKLQYYNLNMIALKNRLTSHLNKLSRLMGIDMNYVVKSGFWVNANFVVASLLGLISSIIFARFVSKETYGTYQFVLSLATIIAVAVPNNVSTAILRSVAQGNEGDLIRGTKFQLRWGIIGTVVASLVSVWYAVNENFGLSFSMITIAIFMPATYALNTWTVYLQGKKEYKRLFFYTTLSTLISYASVFLVIFLKPEYIYIAVANIVAGFIANLVLYILTIKKMKPNNKTGTDTISYGKHLSIMGIPAGLVGQLDVVLIFHYLGAEALAIYSFATLFPERLAGGLKFISTIIFPKFSEKSEGDVRAFFKKKFWWLMGLLSLMILGYWILSPFIFKWLFPAYESAIPYTQVYALSFLAIGASIVHNALLSQKKIKELYISTLAYPLLKALLLFALMFMFGVWGVIWGQIITIIFQIIFPLYLLQKSKII